MSKDLDAESLKYHSSFPPGKIATKSTKPCTTQEDLTLTYTPGVSAPCLEINKDKQKVWDYTNRGNTVAIISDGTAVLGLGNIGPEAGLPVMEGKAVLFKQFADINAYPLCLDMSDAKDEEEYIKNFCVAVRAMEPSVGGINLEDIKAPRCFEIQKKLQKAMKVPVFHDDQDGTGIIITAGVINALKVTGKKAENLKVVMSGAGAAGIACAKMLLKFGIKKEQIFMCDSHGLITKTREVNEEKAFFAQGAEEATLADIIRGADLFIGVSVRGALSGEMVKTMNKDPIIFAVANPIPEIMPEEAFAAGAKVVGTGRSDYPNQVNNSLGFPGIFRGALDARTPEINDAMKIAASEAIASLTEKPFDEEIRSILKNAYPAEASAGIFDRKEPLSIDYVIPKQFDLRVVPSVAKAVVKAAISSGAATVKIKDLDEYEKTVAKRIKANW
ncbi:MAG: malic enzyme-like NAD(P)-binding protein [Candidatus Gracilibacteria bacterium]|jgi:malate dehydrogenase (oxaloacetate-decarboxylating)(NADP+)